jgi:signal transduction histidine kinase
MDWLVTLLQAERAGILARWLAAAMTQPCHRARPERAVSDHIPTLYDALVAVLGREPPVALDADTPVADPAVAAAAETHARERAEQGLRPAEVVVEFRLLRRELRRAVRTHVPADVPLTTAAGAELLLIDALDGVIAIGLAAFTTHAEAVREEFLATTVHEVRHPLTAIRGNAQFLRRLLQQGTATTERLLGLATAMEAETRQLAALVDAMAGASRAALGRLDLQPAAVDLAALTATVVQDLAAETAARVRVTLAPGTDARGYWDGEQLRRVLTNLLANAAKYAPPETPILVSLIGEAEAVEVSVTDQGIGLAPEELPALFRRYSRAPGALEQGIPGLGLGLYLCHAIVERHGGRIWATSPGRGRGATLHVRLPRRATAG